MTGHILYQPAGNNLRLFHQCDKRTRVLIGPLGSGKTKACVIEMLTQINGQVPDAQGVRRSRIVVARNTHIDLANTVVKELQEIIETLTWGELKHTAPATWVANYHHPSGDKTQVDAEILFLAFDDQSDQRKARGLQLSGVYFNELKELNKANVDMLMSRVGRYPSRSQVPNARQFIIADTNAPDRDHWLARLCFDTKPPSWRFFIQPGAVKKVGERWEVNPNAENIQNLIDNYYQHELEGKTESWIRQNLANEFVHNHDGRPVHPEFSEVTHVAEIEAHPSLPITVGIDFGRTPAAAILQKQEDGRWFVLSEFVTENMGALKFGKLLDKELQGSKELGGLSAEYIGDPAGNQMAQTRDETPFQMLNQAGLPAVPAPTNDFEERTTALDMLLTQLIGGKPAIVIHPRCKVLIKGLAGEYQYRRVKVAGDDRFHDKPEKGPSSHVCEALHYGLLGGGEGILSRRISKEEQQMFIWENDRIMEERLVCFE